MFSFRSFLFWGAIIALQPSLHISLSKAELFAMELQLCQAAQAAPSKCSLYGKIQFVDSFPDVKVQVVTSFRIRVGLRFR